jgi:hypothetical protein
MTRIPRTWHPEIITQPRFMDFIREVKERFRSL